MDVGSGLPRSVEDLQGGLLALDTHFGERVRLEAIQHVVVTHSPTSICREPRSLVDVTRTLLGEPQGYGRLLALEEAAAHVEYLFQRGDLGIANLEAVAAEPNPVVLYRNRTGA